MLEGCVFFLWNRHQEYFIKQRWNQVLQTVSEVLLASHKQEQTQNARHTTKYYTAKIFSTIVQAKQFESL